MHELEKKMSWKIKKVAFDSFNFHSESHNYAVQCYKVIVKCKFNVSIYWQLNTNMLDNVNPLYCQGKKEHTKVYIYNPID